VDPRFLAGRAGDPPLASRVLMRLAPRPTFTPSWPTTIVPCPRSDPAPRANRRSSSSGKRRHRGRYFGARSGLKAWPHAMCCWSGSTWRGTRRADANEPTGSGNVSYVDEWADTLGRLAELDFETFVAGHGRPFAGKEALAPVQACLRDLWRRRRRRQGDRSTHPPGGSGHAPAAPYGAAAAPSGRALPGRGTLHLTQGPA